MLRANMAVVVLVVLVAVLFGASAQAEIIVSLSGSTPDSQTITDDQTVIIAKFKLTNLAGDALLKSFTVGCTGVDIIYYMSLKFTNDSGVTNTYVAAPKSVSGGTGTYSFTGLYACELSADCSYTLTLSACLGRIQGKFNFNTGEEEFATYSLQAGVYDASAKDAITGDAVNVRFAYTPLIGNTITVVSAESVPEPSAIALLSVGGAGLGLVALRKKFRR